MSELQSRLEAAQAAKRELERKRAERDAAYAEEQQVLAAEREVEELAALDKAECEYGVNKVALVKTPLGAIILKRANTVTFRKFQDDGKLTTLALEKLVGPCVVYPSSDKFDKLLEELPAVLPVCANAIAELAGAGAAEVSKK